MLRTRGVRGLSLRTVGRVGYDRGLCGNMGVVMAEGRAGLGPIRSRNTSCPKWLRFQAGRQVRGFGPRARCLVRRVPF